jgi:glutathione transport system substrate-binding protein
MRKRSILLLAGALAIAASLMIGPAATAGPEVQSAGTVVFVHDQEPPNLNNDLVGNGLYATSLVMNRVLESGAAYNNKAQLKPILLSGLPKLIKKKPLTASLTYKPNAVWSDGRQITGKDFRTAWQVYINPANNIRSRTGWEDIKSVKAKGKTATVVFKKTFAPWQELLASSPLPSHKVAGQNYNQLWLNSIDISSGPWKFTSWQKGVQLTVSKNARFKALPTMKLDRVVFRYILDTNARFQALKSGEGQVMEPQAQLQIAEFRTNKQFQVQSLAGFSYEHVDIQLGPQGHVALRQPYIRRALIQGMNRKQISGALYGTIAPGLPVLNNLIYKTFEGGYKGHFSKWTFNQKKVIADLKAKGCTGGPNAPSPSNNDIFSCPGVGKLSFRFGTTTGNQLRALTFEIIQKQLKSVGIELLPRFQVAGTLFGTTLPSGDFDLAMYTWVQSPASKITAKDLYSCGGELNYMKYCNRKATKALNTTAQTLDPAARAKLLDKADAIMANDIPSIPMFVRPEFFIRNVKVKGPLANPTLTGDTWNVNVWTTS